MTAVRATFEDVKRVKTRKVWQLIFEVPEENYDTAIQALGGSPQSGIDRWVGIAPITAPGKPVQTQTAPEAPKTPEKLKGGDRARMAGILCNDTAFQNWLFELEAVTPWLYSDLKNIPYASAAAEIVRRLTGCQESRSELDHNDDAGRIWDQIDRDYRAAALGRTDDDLTTQANAGP